MIEDNLQEGVTSAFPRMDDDDDDDDDDDSGNYDDSNDDSKLAKNTKTIIRMMICSMTIMMSEFAVI